ncbi:hypothetical protein ACLK1Z_10895 [Escherichia coli]
MADAYERLLLETMRGIQALFVRRDEVEEAWKWVDSITQRGRWTMMRRNRNIRRNRLLPRWR